MSVLPLAGASSEGEDGAAPAWVGAGVLATEVRSLTTARVLLGRAGVSYPTAALLELRADHAAARDAVHSRVDLTQDHWQSLREQGLFSVASRAATPGDHLLRPALGRQLSADARRTIGERCVPGADVQIVLGDGLSAAALDTQAGALVHALTPLVLSKGWTLGTAFFVRHCRVGIMNDVGAALRPRFVVLLIGERPGLGSALSMSAYLAYRPGPGHSDADRNLISNIHAQGVLAPDPPRRIVRLLETMDTHSRSGVSIKEPTQLLRLEGSDVRAADAAVDKEI